jgi:hypothetical protein
MGLRMIDIKGGWQDKHSIWKEILPSRKGWGHDNKDCSVGFPEVA